MSSGTGSFLGVENAWTGVGYFRSLGNFFDRNSFPHRPHQSPPFCPIIHKGFGYLAIDSSGSSGSAAGPAAGDKEEDKGPECAEDSRPVEMQKLVK